MKGDKKDINQQQFWAANTKYQCASVSSLTGVSF